MQQSESDMFLALDTATRHSGLALLDHHHVLAELNWYSADGQTTELMPRLTQLLAWHAIKPGQLRGLAVSLGPGSFTGLRIALSTAKGMALAHGLALVGIPTLDATAYPHLGGNRTVCALVQAGRGRVCWALYGQDAPQAMEGAVALELQAWQGWRTPYRLSSLNDMLPHLSDDTFFTGELWPSTAQALLLRGYREQQLASPAVALRRAAVIAELGQARVTAGDLDDPASLAPIYLREP